MNNEIKSTLLVLGAAAALLTTATADEYLWLYTRSAETLPKGEVEVIVSAIDRNGKDSGSYSFIDVRPELEYGITDKLTVSVEAMLFRHDYSNVEWEPISENESFSDTQLGGYEVTFKYNLISPYKGGVGLAVGLGYEHRDQYRLDGADIDQDSFVPAVYLQKNFLDNTLMTSFTGKVEFERRKAGTVLEEEVALEFATGISYRVAKGFFVGAEVRYQSDFLNPQDYAEAGNEGFDAQGFEEGYERSSFDLSDFRLGSQYQYGTYFGPTFHYAAQKWWVTGGILFQVKGGGDESRNPSIYDNRSWDEHEEYHLGLIFGRPF